MQRKRDDLIPVGEVLSYLGGPVAAIRAASPQALHHFTRFDQVNQLVSASEADPALGFMGRTMALCSLPRTNPGNRLQYKRVNGPFKLIMTATGDHKLPFGNLPRLILAWVSTEAVRTQSREIVLGKSFSEFMRTLGVYSSGGRDRTRLRNQMNRLFNASVRLVYKNEHARCRGVPVGDDGLMPAPERCLPNTTSRILSETSEPSTGAWVCQGRSKGRPSRGENLFWKAPARETPTSACARPFAAQLLEARKCTPAG